MKRCIEIVELNCFKAFLVSFFLVMIAQISVAQEFDNTIGEDTETLEVAEDLVVPFGEIWRVTPGAEICFDEGISIEVEGVLVADGNTEKPIVFRPCHSDKYWAGMRFSDSRALGGVRSTLSHVVVEGAQKARDDYNERVGVDAETAGGGIYAERSDLDIINSTIRRNKAEIGGGIYIGPDSDVTVKRSAIYSNEALGSRYIFSGGGGVYVSNARRASIVQSVIALNSFAQGSYPNEEGGGGIYLASGPIDLLLSLVIANESGKAAGMLVHSDGRAPKREFVANIFMYNYGSKNLEQVALQTRNSYDELVASGEWSANAGQMPFVAHLNRNALASYQFRGSSLFLKALRPGELSTISEEFEDRAIPAVFLDTVGALRGRRLCGDTWDFGPIEICTDEQRSLTGYLSSLGEIFGSDLAETLGTEIAAPEGQELSQADRERLGRLIEQAQRPKAPGELPRSGLDKNIIDLVFGNPSERQSSIRALRQSRDNMPLRGSHPPVLLAHGFGLVEEYLALAEPDDISIELLRAALRNRDQEVARALLERSGGKVSKREMYELFHVAASSNLTEVIIEFLDDGLNANLPLRERLPLHLAVAEGHLDTVQLLLRRGADPSSPALHAPQEVIVPLVAALDWFHLGSGRHEIAELLIAAGAEATVEDLKDGVLSSALRLQSAVEVGIVDPDAAREQAEIIVPQGDWDSRVRQRLIDGLVQVRPVIAAVRNLRALSTEELTAMLEDESIDEIERAAVSRILAVRNFELTPQIRSQILAASRMQQDHVGVTAFSIERILQYRSAERIALAKGGGAAKPLAAEPDQTDRQGLPYIRKLAIVIGISDYAALPPRNLTSLRRGDYTDLAFAETDATEIVRLLESGRLGPNWEIEALVGSRATLAEAQRVMTLWSQEAGPEDLVVFFFSGHGFEDSRVQERSYFFMQDSRLDGLDSTALSFATVRDWALNLEARHVLLLLDACRSGSIGTAKGGWSSLDYDVLEDRRANQLAGKIALTSSLGEQLSFEWTERQMGYFTATLIDAIEGRIANYASDKFIEIDELYQALLASVPERSATGGRNMQIPDYVLLDGSDLLRFPVALNF